MITVDALPPRFWAKVEVLPNGCWQWTAAKNSDGYGLFKIGGRVQGAHRVCYEALIGFIPEGLQSDHLCRNRACVNPAHIEPVTSHENILRGDCPAAMNAQEDLLFPGASLGGRQPIYRG